MTTKVKTYDIPVSHFVCTGETRQHMCSILMMIFLADGKLVALRADVKRHQAINWIIICTSGAQIYYLSKTDKMRILPWKSTPESKTCLETGLPPFHDVGFQLIKLAGARILLLWGLRGPTERLSKT